eukprot:gnl/Trimastix_PCT/1874.p3 GENE.gnl/Trimastix_PCT/1874~~gnl/Trimastix_PCT/1874.p3  ORF type:complete len:103 (+),score=21.16 gnl/Trimastix_PCT/1874:67-375(+)
MRPGVPPVMVGDLVPDREFETAVAPDRGIEIVAAIALPIDMQKNTDAPLIAVLEAPTAHLITIATHRACAAHHAKQSNIAIPHLPIAEDFGVDLHIEMMMIT